MKRFLMIALAISMIALVAMPAFAEVQNIKVSGQVNVKGVVRDNFSTTGSGGGRTVSGFSETANDSRDFYMTTTALGVDADLTDNVAATILMANERDWGSSASNQNIVALQSYVTMKELLYSPLTLKVGRMPIVLADGLVIGKGVTADSGLLADDLSVQKEFDGIVGVLDYDPLTVILGTAKLSDAAQSSTDDVDVYVADAIYKFEDDMNTVLDLYLVNAHYNSAQTASGATGASTKATDIYVFAGNVKTEPMENLTVSGSLGMQTGDYQKTASSTRDLGAMAFDIMASYALENDYQPVVYAKYLFRSGNDKSKTGANDDYEGWLPLYENQQNGMIVDPNTNASAFAIGGTMVPMDRLTVGLDILFLALAEDQLATASTTTSDELGTEVDLYAKYAYTEDVGVGLALAWFMPGDYYANTYDETAMQAVLSLDVKF